MARTFYPVWFQRSEPTDHPNDDMDMGKLVVGPDGAEFSGMRYQVSLRGIRDVSVAPPPKRRRAAAGPPFAGLFDRIYRETHWVKVDYEEGPELESVYVADGRWLGWGAALRARNRILAAFQSRQEYRSSSENR